MYIGWVSYVFYINKRICNSDTNYATQNRVRGNTETNICNNFARPHNAQVCGAYKRCAKWTPFCLNNAPVAAAKLYLYLHYILFFCVQINVTDIPIVNKDVMCYCCDSM